MTILQIAAARLAGVARLWFYAFDDAGQAVLAQARAFDTGDDPVAAVHAGGFRWGVGDGN
jgi:hypothetical protein